MNIMDPIIRVAENDRWRALDAIYERKTNEAQDTSCEAAPIYTASASTMRISMPPTRSLCV